MFFVYLATRAVVYIYYFPIFYICLYCNIKFVCSLYIWPLVLLYIFTTFQYFIYACIVIYSLCVLCIFGHLCCCIYLLLSYILYMPVLLCTYSVLFVYLATSAVVYIYYFPIFYGLLPHNSLSILASH